MDKINVLRKLGMSSLSWTEGTSEREIRAKQIFSTDNFESEITNTDQEFFMRYLNLDDVRKRLSRDVVVEFSKSNAKSQSNRRGLN